jgi:hypothetical protein
MFKKKSRRGVYKAADYASYARKMKEQKAKADEIARSSSIRRFFTSEMISKIASIAGILGLFITVLALVRDVFDLKWPVQNDTFTPTSQDSGVSKTGVSDSPSNAPSSRPTASATPVKAEIVNQHLDSLDGSLVDRNIKVVGKLSGLTAGDSLWMYVYPLGKKRYYPFKATYDPDSKMWQRSLTIGSVEKGASGASFEIGLFTANARISEDLSKWGETGTHELPQGIVSLKSVIVKRK